MLVYCNKAIDNDFREGDVEILVTGTVSDSYGYSYDFSNSEPIKIVVDRTKPQISYDNTTYFYTTGKKPFTLEFKVDDKNLDLSKITKPTLIISSLEDIDTGKTCTISKIEWTNNSNPYVMRVSVSECSVPEGGSYKLKYQFDGGSFKDLADNKSELTKGDTFVRFAAGSIDLPYQLEICST